MHLRTLRLRIISRFRPATLWCSGPTYRNCYRTRRPHAQAINREASHAGDSLQQRPGTDKPSLPCLGIELCQIQPARPMQNGPVESFHGRLPEECLRASWFSNLFDARSKITDWRKEYNEVRPHSSLDYRLPTSSRRRSRGRAREKTQATHISTVRSRSRF